MQHNPNDRTEHNGNALSRMWRSWEDEWLNFPSKERQDQIYMTVEQDTIEEKRRDVYVLARKYMSRPGHICVDQHTYVLARTYYISRTNMSRTNMF